MLARRFGFVGRIEYRHVLANTGGAQYGRGTRAERDVLTVDARAFQRDADPEDFSLEAIIAHERGHQIVQRSPYSRAIVARGMSVASDEALASLAGSIICDSEADRESLFWKAASELHERFMALDDALPRLRRIRHIMRQALS